jgi:hypothetical protein
VSTGGDDGHLIVKSGIEPLEPRVLPAAPRPRTRPGTIVITEELGGSIAALEHATGITHGGIVEGPQALNPRDTGFPG